MSSELGQRFQIGRVVPDDGRPFVSQPDEYSQAGGRKARATIVKGDMRQGKPIKKSLTYERKREKPNTESEPTRMVLD